MIHEQAEVTPANHWFLALGMERESRLTFCRGLVEIWDGKSMPVPYGTGSDDG